MRGGGRPGEVRDLSGVVGAAFVSALEEGPELGLEDLVAGRAAEEPAVAELGVGGSARGAGADLYGGVELSGGGAGFGAADELGDELRDLLLGLDDDPLLAGALLTEMFLGLLPGLLGELVDRRFFVAEIAFHVKS